MTDQTPKTDAELFHQPRGEATVYLGRPDGGWKRHSIGGYPIMNDDGTPVPFLTYNAKLYGEPAPFAPDAPHAGMGPGWLYREMGPCADQGDWAASGNEWFPAAQDDPDHTERMLGVEQVKWLYRMLGHVSAYEEGRAMMALGLAKGLVGLGHHVGSAFRGEDERVEFFLSWQLGRMLSSVIQNDDGTWAYDEDAVEWLAKWKAARAEKAAAGEVSS